MSSLTNSSSSKTKKQPWYKNYMVLIFVIVMPLSVVIACIWFVFYSVQIKDSVVRDDWYMDGKTLYSDVSKDKLAHDLNLSATMNISHNGQVTLKLITPNNFTLPETLNVEISHATQVNKDRDFNVTKTTDGQYVGQVSIDANLGKYYIILHDSKNSWRLRSTHNLPTTTTLYFKPLKAFDIPAENLPSVAKPSD